MRRITDHVMRLYKTTPRGGAHSLRFGFKRLSFDKPSNTITRGGGDTGLFHPDECRKLTVAELKRVASFPDQFKFAEGYIYMDKDNPLVLSGRARKSWDETKAGKSHHKLYGHVKLGLDKPSNTLTKFNGENVGFFHPTEPRRVSAVEYARLASFPKQFDFGPSWESTINQIGNCVPPLLIRAVAEELAGVKRENKGAISMKRLLGTALRDASKTYVADLDDAWRAHLAPKGKKAPTVASLFAGCGGSSLGYSMAGYREVLAVEWDAKACATFRLNFPDVPLHEGDIALLTNRKAGAMSGLKPGELDVLDGSPPCFAAGTPVTTRRGVVPIEAVVKGDYVLTHKCRWRRVTRTMTRFAPTILVAKRIETTKDHRFYARERMDTRELSLGDPAWVAANLIHGKFLGVPQHIGKTDMPSPPDGFKYDEDFWYIVGRWLGDGWVRLTKGDPATPVSDRPKQNKKSIPCRMCGKPSAENKHAPGIYTNYCTSKCRARHKATHREPARFETYICTGHGDKDNLAGFLCKLGVAFCCSPGASTVKFTISRKSLAIWINKWFGKGAGGKTLPGWSLGMPREHREALFTGYDAADGDGSSATSVSRCLITGIALLATSLGKTANLTGPSHDKRTEMFGRKVKTRPAWQISYFDDNGYYTKSENGIRWKKLRQPTTHKSNKTRVYDIEVDEDHSFVADMFIVHNCQGFSTAGKRMIDDPRNQLFREYVRLLRYFRPKRLVMENVTGMVKGGMVDTFHEIMREIRLCGYKVEARVLNAMHYGVPQARQRVIFVGSRVGDPVFPDPWSEPITVRDAWAGLDFDGAAMMVTAGNERHTIAGRTKPWTLDNPSSTLLASGNTIMQRNFVAPKPGSKAHKALSSARQGERLPDYGIAERLHMDGVAGTLRTGEGHPCSSWFSHPVEMRGISLEEAKRIGSFPDRFAFFDFKSGCKQIGNCVPPLLIRAVAERLALHGESGDMSDFKRKAYAATKRGHKARGVLGLFTRLSWTGIAPTVMRQFGVYGVAGLYHPDEPRPLTVGEYRRIASFPDGFKFGAWLDAVAQMGNCVPPLLVRAMAEALSV